MNQCPLQLYFKFAKEEVITPMESAENQCVNAVLYYSEGTPSESCLSTSNIIDFREACEAAKEREEEFILSAILKNIAHLG